MGWLTLLNSWCYVPWTPITAWILLLLMFRGVTFTRTLSARGKATLGNLTFVARHTRSMVALRVNSMVSLCCDMVLDLGGSMLHELLFDCFPNALVIRRGSFPGRSLRCGLHVTDVFTPRGFG